MQVAVLNPFLIHLLAACMLTGIAGGARAEDQTVEFVLPEVYPWSYHDEAGRKLGVLVDLTERLSEISGVPVAIRLRPHRRARDELDKGRADFAMLFASPEADRAAHNVGQLITTRLVAATLPGSETPASLAQLEDKAVVHIHGTYYGDAYEAAEAGITHAVKDLSTALALLRLGRVDVLVTFDYALQLTLDSLGRSRSSVAMLPLAPGQDGHLYMSRKSSHPEALEPISQALEQLRESGELIRLLSRPPTVY